MNEERIILEINPRTKEKKLVKVTDEFLIYNTYVEECKVKAKQFIAERERVINE